MRLHWFHFVRGQGPGDAPGTHLIADPQIVGQSQLSAVVQLQLPAVIQAARIVAQSQLTATISGVVATDLPCPAFPVLRLEAPPVRQSDPDRGALLAEKAERINHREVVLQYDLLSEADREQVLAVWDGGAGAVRPFEFTVPGEGSARRFVFKDPNLSIEHLNSVQSKTTIALRDVSRGAGA